MAATDVRAAGGAAGLAEADAAAEAFFEGSPLGAAVYRRVLATVPAAEVRVGKSQIAFRRRRAFAWLWRPRMYLGARGAAVALSIALPRRDESPRWKEVVRPASRRWMHHLELGRVDEIDDEVEAWIREAATDAA